MIEAIYIMWQRQIKQYLRKKERIIGGLAQPTLFLIALSLGFGPVYAQAGEGNYIQFLGPGIIGMSILFGSVFNGVSLIWDKQFGFLKETLVAPVPRIGLLLGRCLGGATTSAFQGVIVLFISFFMGFKIHNYNLLPLAFLMMFLISFMFTLVGTIIASKMDDMHAFPLVMNFLIMPIFFLSGTLFSINNFPKTIKTLTKINPLTYGIDSIRYSLTGINEFNIFLDMFVIFSVIAVLLVIGKICFEKIEP
jgi:ABC-2 type transport system permease protein